MGRMSAGDPITIKPQNNAFTVLAAAAVLVQLLGFIVLFMRAKELLDNGLFGG
jgi:hypothetical protein